MDEEARQRAERRRQQAAEWPLRAYPLGREPVQDPLDRSTVDDRIRSMWPLAREAWSVARQPIPAYERANMPGVLVRQAW